METTADVSSWPDDAAGKLEYLSARIHQAPSREEKLNQALLELVGMFEGSAATIHVLRSADDGKRTSLSAQNEMILEAFVGLPPTLVDRVRIVPVGKGMAG